jgi:hypothetical protein
MERDLSRRDLLDSWRRRVDAAERAFKQAAIAAAAALESCDCTSGSGDLHALQEAQHRESVALDEYMHVLRVLHELAVHGKVPPDKPIGDG